MTKIESRWISCLFNWECVRLLPPGMPNCCSSNFSICICSASGIALSVSEKRRGVTLLVYLQSTQKKWSLFMIFSASLRSLRTGISVNHFGNIIRTTLNDPTAHSGVPSTLRAHSKCGAKLLLEQPELHLGNFSSTRQSKECSVWCLQTGSRTIQPSLGPLITRPGKGHYKATFTLKALKKNRATHHKPPEVLGTENSKNGKASVFKHI